MEETPQVSPKLVHFLYILLRDHLPFGTVEEILANHVEKVDRNFGLLPESDRLVTYSEHKMEDYARSLAFRIQHGGSKSK